jgi:integrase
MATSLKLLSNPTLKNWLKAGLPLAKADGGGLTFTLSKAGTATWTFRYRLAGQRNELTIGRYPDISLSDARLRAAALRVAVSDGKDPAAEKRQMKAALSAANSFSELALDYMKRRAPALAENSRHEIQRYLDKDILPRIGHIRADEISPDEVIRLIERVEKRSQSVARRTFEIISVIYSHGIAKRIVKTNPCAGLKVSAILGERIPKRPRIKLSEEQLKFLLPALKQTGPSNEAALKILLATCVRKSALILATWDEIDFERATWTIPPAPGRKAPKNAPPFVVPLAPAVLGWFKELRGYAGHSQRVLPTRRYGAERADKSISRSTLNSTIDRLAKSLDVGFEFAPHDLRSTAKSHLAAMKVDPLVSERCLNHSIGGLEAIYNKHYYL